MSDVEDLEEELRDSRTSYERERGLDDESRLLPPGPAAPAFVRVCDRFTADGAVCGQTISSDDYPDSDDPENSARAAWARHVRIEHPKDRTVREERAANAKKPKREKAPRTARQVIDDAKPPIDAPHTTGKRSDAYASGLAQYALIGYLVPGSPIDEFDLATITQGAPNLANALEQLGDRHAVVRTALDLALTGGGGPYAATLMGLLAIAAPIAAHHGLVPLEVGERFGILIGVASVPPPKSRPAPATAAPTSEADAPAANAGDEPADPAAWLTDPPVDPRQAAPDIRPSDMPATPSGRFTPLGEDRPVGVVDGVRSDNADPALEYSF